MDQANFDINFYNSINKGLGSKANTNDEFDIDFASILAEFDLAEDIDPRKKKKKVEDLAAPERLIARPNPIKVHSLATDTDIAIENINKNEPLSLKQFKQIAELANFHFKEQLGG